MKKFFIDNWFRLIIVLVSAVLVTFIGIYLNKKSELAEIRQIQEQQLQKEKDQKEFAADQKTACLNIYKTESSEWNNVSGWQYNEGKNECIIEYKQQPKKTKEQCTEDYNELTESLPEESNIRFDRLLEYAYCLDGLFIKTF